MINFLDKTDIRISVARHERLGPEWRTDRFSLASRIIPLNRLFFPLEGSGEAEYNGRHYDLQRGKMLLIPAYAQVNLSCKQKLVKYWSHFNIHILDSELDLFTLYDNCLEIELAENDMVIAGHLFERLASVYSNPYKEVTPLEKFETESALRLLITPFLRLLSDYRPPSQISGMIGLLSFIENNLSQDLTLAELGRQVKLHPNYLSALFKEKMGLPPMVYLNRRRVQRAIYLIRTTDLTIGEITAEVGISNVQVFSKIFKKHIGQSPANFKKQVLAENESGWN